MTHRERLETLKNGGTLTRPAYAAWGHVMNLSDLNAADFARATIDYQKTHDFDFVKVIDGLKKENIRSGSCRRFHGAGKDFICFFKSDI